MFVPTTGLSRRAGARWASLAAAISAMGGISAAPRSARADVGYEFTGIRSEAMGGAHRAVGTSNDTIMLNPAGMSMRRRYSLEASYGYSGQDTLSHISFSALDSKTGPVAGALGYTHSRGDHAFSNVELHRIYMASAYPIFDWLAVGLTARHLRGSFTDDEGERQNVESYTADLGLSAVLFDFLGVGVVWHNVYTTSRKALSPPHLGFGLAYLGEELVVASDLEVDLRPRHLGDLTFRVGGEYFLAEMFPVRFGYRLRPRIKKYGGDKTWESVLGGGLGFVTESGSVEVTYTHSVEVLKNWDVMASLKIFF